MMAYDWFESGWDNFGKFIQQFQSETNLKLEKILIELYRQNESVLFKHTHTHTHTHIYIYIYKLEINPTVLIYTYMKKQVFRGWFCL